MKVLAAVVLAGLAAALPTEKPRTKRALNTLSIGMQWDYPLGYPNNFKASDANASVPFYSVDLENTDPSDITTLRNQNHYVACYFSAGTWEEYRDDADQFPDSAKGSYLQGYDDERWVNTNDPTVRQIMVNRMKEAKANGCQGVDPDNIDAYDNSNGLGLTQDDAVNYVNFLTSNAHSLGLTCGLKNGGAIVPRVVSVTDFSVNEQCVQFNECLLFKPFIDQGKPVFHVEYTNGTKTPSPSDIAWNCYSRGVKGFSSIIKHVSLDKYRIGCT